MIISHLIIITLNLAVTAINIVEFFLIVRLILSYRPVTWLVPFDRAGKTLTDSTTTLTEKLFRKFSLYPLRDKQNLALSLLVLELIKILCCII